MSTIHPKIIIAGLVFLFIFLSGFWLSRNGSPYGTGLLAIHKLISLGIFVFLIVTVVKVNKETGLSGSEWTLGIITAVFFIGTILAGGLLSTDLELPTAVLTIHHITPYLTLLLTVATLYLLLNSKL